MFVLPWTLQATRKSFQPRSPSPPDKAFTICESRPNIARLLYLYMGDNKVASYWVRCASIGGLTEGPLKILASYCNGRGPPEALLTKKHCSKDWKEKRRTWKDFFVYLLILERRQTFQGLQIRSSRRPLVKWRRISMPNNQQYFFWQVP